MKVLVTGSTGFVGQHVVKELGGDHELLLPSHKDLNLLTPDLAVLHHRDTKEERYCMGSSALAMYLMQHGVEAVVHLAATCGGIGINKDNPGRFIYENLQMGINVLEAARLAGVSKVVNLGTVCAYPKHTPVPFVESEIWNGYPEETNAPYGIAKKTVMEMGRAYHEQYDMDVTNLVPVNMAGEWDNFDLYSSHVIPALIRKFEEPDIDMATKQVSVTLWGTGSASREFLYAGDCARAIGIALEKNTGPEPINLGTGGEVTIRDLAERIKVIGSYTNVDIEWDDTKPDGQPRRCLDITRARNVLRWEPRVSLDELLQRTIQWYREHGSV